MLNLMDISNEASVNNFMKAFFDVTEMSISFADQDHKQYNTFYAGSRCEFCRIMNCSLNGLENCVRTSKEAGKKAAKEGKALVYTCHAGLKEVVVPIIINGRHIGSVFSGQVLTKSPSQKSYSEIREYITSLGLDADQTFPEYMKIPVIPSGKLDLAANMLKIVVDYIVQSEMNQVLKEKVNREREKLREIIPYIKSQFVNYIITNNTEKLSEIKDKMMYLGIRRVPNAVIYVRVNDGKGSGQSSKDKINEKVSVADLIGNEFNKMRDLVVYAIDHDSIAVFAHIKNGLQDNLKNAAILSLAERIKGIISKRTVFTANIGVSRCCRNSIGLSTAYREAFNAYTYGTIMGIDQIIHIDDIQTEGNAGSPIFLDSEKIKRNIVLANENELSGMLYHAFNQFLTNNKADLDTVKTYTIEFLNQVLDSAIEMGLDESYTSKRIKYLEQLIGLNTIQDIYSWGKRIISSILMDVTSGRTSKNKEIIERVKNYTEENYRDELTLEDAASVVFLSPNYFGWLFKKETGESYIEYLTRIRVAMAITLMRTTNESIFAISEMVGYKDPNYFSQVFKKIEGIRPSVYRKSLNTGQ